MIKKFALGIFSVGMTLAIAHAAAPAADQASNSPYEPGNAWSNGQNGGTGFGAWVLSGGTNAGFFMDTSTNNGTGGSLGIDTAGKSWGEFANSGQTASAVRPFTAGGPNSDITLAVGQGISLAFDNGNIASGSTVGFGLQNATGTNRFEFYYVGSASVNSYKININGTEFNLSPTIGFTADGFSNITFMQEAANSWSLTITENNPSGTTTYSSSNFADLAASDISQIRLFDANGGGGTANNDYFNSLEVVPEPGTWLAGAMTLVGCFYLRRRPRIS